jgi:hypothetical protein
MLSLFLVFFHFLVDILQLVFEILNRLFLLMSFMVNFFLEVFVIVHQTPDLILQLLIMIFLLLVFTLNHIPDLLESLDRCFDRQFIFFITGSNL